MTFVALAAMPLPSSTSSSLAPVKMMRPQCTLVVHCKTMADVTGRKSLRSWSSVSVAGDSTSPFTKSRYVESLDCHCRSSPGFPKM